jgi:alkyl hydroperoxide reductase subunit AhpC
LGQIKDKIESYLSCFYRKEFDEILRVIDSLQLTADYKVATPANWKDGDDVVISPAIKMKIFQRNSQKVFKE